MPLRRIGLNLLYLVPGETGGSEVVARSIVPLLPEVAPDLEFVAFVNDETAPEARALVGDRVAVSHLSVSGRSRVRRTLAEQIALPRAARDHSLDLLHSFASTGPAMAGPTSVVTVLDVIYATEPQAHTQAMRLGMSVLVPLAARHAERLITISHAAASEIAQVLKIDASVIDVTHLAGRPAGPTTHENELRSRYALEDRPIVLSVSARRPHKNLPRLLEAFAQVEHDPHPLLVLPGYPTIQDDELVRLAGELGVAERVRFLGWVSDEDLDGLYAIASCFAFASLAEGFGLPVLEAMDRGVPVACSNVSSMPEVAGDAACYFDPTDVPSMAKAIGKLLDDREYAQQLTELGLERAKRFSWKRTAEETVASYRRAYESSKSE